MSKIDHEHETEWYLNLPLAELEAQAGLILLGEGLGAGGLNPRAGRRAYHEWFDVRRQELQRLVCSSPLVQDLVSNSGQDLTTIATLIMPIANNHQLALLVAAILLRAGIVSFCSDWTAAS